MIQRIKMVTYASFPVKARKQDIVSPESNYLHVKHRKFKSAKAILHFSRSSAVVQRFHMTSEKFHRPWYQLQ